MTDGNGGTLWTHLDAVTFGLTGLTADQQFVHKQGDTMTGVLNLPLNGLVAGNDQLVLSDNKVGVGTLAPAEKLDVLGNVKATGFIGDGSQLTNVSGTDVTKVLKTGDTMTGPLNVVKNYNERTLITVENSDTGGSSFAAVRVKSTSNAYFGINSPGYGAGNGMGSDRAFVYGDGAGVSLRAVAPGGNILFGAGGDIERMRITNTGSVGIGTMSPTQRVEVAGNVKATGFIGDGSLLTNVSGTDVTKVLKTGDTMTGTLNLPSNGLSVGSNQLVVVGGNVGIGTIAPAGTLESINTLTVNIAPPSGGTPPRQAVA